ncbi:protein phosphatase methylesterase 1-like isoform X2 [Paramormyrops kingsleyae]|uniref:protein phosphatase methylesterase 1-like isoform X2 n=1 Tax=Paramormyrops kingsleyae TaxID=1676925 RepID=UPI003B97B8B6
MEKQLHLNLLATRPPMAGGLQSGSRMRMGPGRKKDFSPLPWNKYFEAMDDVEVQNDSSRDTFRVYSSGSQGPVLLLLHGGGHSALSWAVFTSVICARISCRVVAMDLRGHGDSKVKNPEDLSAEAMAKDVGKVVEALYGENAPPIMIIGHSMGGAIAVHTAAANHVPSLIGLCVIDVVEGTAMDALNSMQNFLRSRPKTFKSLENAIEWSVKSGQIRNMESARVSMVGQVKRCEEPVSSPGVSKCIVEGIIEEDEEDEDGGESDHKRKKEDDQEVKKECLFTWRIELSKTEKYWDGWFRGLSALFLSCSIPKLLLLAGFSNQPTTVCQDGPPPLLLPVLSTGAPQVCVLSPFLYFLYTYHCNPTHNTNVIMKFDDDTTVVGLISSGDEMAYREDVHRLTANNLVLNTKKTKELIIDFRRKMVNHQPLVINGEVVERVSTFKFLGTYMSEDLMWTNNTYCLIRKAQQRLYFLRVLRKINLPHHLLVSFYHCSIESVLTYGTAEALQLTKNALQRVIRTAEKLTNTPLPTLESIFTSRCFRKTTNIIKDSSHPAHSLFQLLPSGR